jgi:hypothetical protein
VRYRQTLEWSDDPFLRLDRRVVRITLPAVAVLGPLTVPQCVF